MLVPLSENRWQKWTACNFHRILEAKAGPGESALQVQKIKMCLEFQVNLAKFPSQDNWLPLYSLQEPGRE